MSDSDRPQFEGRPISDGATDPQYAARLAAYRRHGWLDWEAVKSSQIDAETADQRVEADVSEVTVFTSAGPDDLEALHDEICRTFGAIHCPSLDQLDAMLRKHGWAPQIREIRMPIEPELT